MDKNNKTSTVYSIGHSDKNLETLISELKAWEIKYVLDVRSTPYSKKYPHFNREILKMELKKHEIIYAYFGGNLGGLPSDRSCYTDGRVDYQKVEQKVFFKEGIKRIKDANNQGLNIALMCSECDPKTCHRSKLIGQALMKENVEMNHIISSKRVKSQTEVINELTKGRANIFEQTPMFYSRKIYI
jgi:uncharacterized protein (DUF488 family)